MFSNHVPENIGLTKLAGARKALVKVLIKNKSALKRTHFFISGKY